MSFLRELDFFSKAFKRKFKPCDLVWVFEKVPNVENPVEYRDLFGTA